MSALERTVSGILASWSAVHFRLPRQYSMQLERLEGSESGFKRAKKR